jgi:hypothetical protein
MRVGPVVDRDVFAPESRHNYYVTSPADLQDVAGWSRGELYAAVEAADDGEDGCVVVDYGRDALYLAAGRRLSYRPPRLFGVGGEPALVVPEARQYDPESGEGEPLGEVVVSPTFDVLVPAFDWSALDEDDLPPTVPWGSRSPASAGTPSS